MGIFIVLLFILLGIGISILQKQSHERRITEYVESIGGSVVTIERKHFSIGPFMVVGKGRTVYRFEYRIDGYIKEGWVRFGGFLGPDWRL